MPQTYRASAGDEAFDANAVPREPYAGILQRLEEISPPDLVHRAEAAAGWSAERDLYFTVNNEHRPFAIDLVPRIVSARDWTELSAGLIQRARSIEAFLQDAYGDRRIVDAGIVPGSRMEGAPGWRAEAKRLPAGTLRAPVQGFDLVRDEQGQWRVLEDNVRSPSGVAYSFVARALIDDVMPDLTRPDGLLDPTTAIPLTKASILGPAGQDGVGAVLTSGPESGAWFEHHRLAELTGFLLVQPDDLDVVDGRVLQRESGRQIDALYLRMDGELVDQVDSAGRTIGAEVFEVAAAGHLFLANAPGNGVADDKSMYCFVPDFIDFYLREAPLMKPVTTYCACNPRDLPTILDRVADLVTKPVDGEGGRGVMIGPDASAQELDDRRAAIADDPDRWIAQELVELSCHPTLVGGELVPRHVDLRVFVYATGPDLEDYQVAPAALTRMAAENSRIVNSSAGGGAKDTWIIGADVSDEVDAVTVN